ncbi:MAG: hypothetical protein RIQ93_2456 [Verrucomicrobiota bacterium]|jgi:hypothetical protein
MLVALALTGAALSAAENGQWISLFDGKSLKGWKKIDGTAKIEVRDGAIVGIVTPGADNTYIATEDASFGDFIFECEFRCDAGNNSGVMYRSQFAHGNAKIAYGYQYEIDPTPRALTGGLYDEGGKPRRGWTMPEKSSGEPRDAWNKKHGDRFKPGEWNKMRIEARGRHLRTFLNGHLLTDFVDNTDLYLARGFIGMQVHPQKDPNLFGKEVAFRNLRVQRLD